MTLAKRTADRTALLPQGMARAILRRDGVLPDNAPNFPNALTRSLLDFGFGLLTAALALRRSDQARTEIADAFRQAAEALDAVTRNGGEHIDSDFIRVITAAAFHLGGFAARAYTALPNRKDPNNSTAEKLLSCLISRDLLSLRQFASSFVQGDGREASVIEASTELATETIVERMVTGQFSRAMSNFSSALTSGDRALVLDTNEKLTSCLQVAEALGLLQLWWTIRMAIELLDDLWNASLHQLLPLDLVDADDEKWRILRQQYIDNLVNRRRSESELWPSQLAAFALVFQSEENAVIALPTGAGKTRIAELAILKALGRGKRVAYVTPLRALSAQVERGLRDALRGTSYGVSAVYSAIGAQAADIISMHEADVVVMTPEKLQFAIRLDPSILDDVGLIILDEGHMIGSSPREIRYEILVQKLLRRPDAAQRRLICLSAALPSGNDLTDFSTWLTGAPEHAVDINWRPTQLRFGDVTWKSGGGWLTFYSDDRRDGYFAPRFVEPRRIPTPAGRQLRDYPRTRQELILGTAARYASDAQTVLIYCPQKNSVESLAAEAVESVERGGIELLRRDSLAMQRAIRSAREWLGNDHVAVRGLNAGIGMHHGDLPLPIREAMESLFRAGDIRVLISSPTLAQGLNITVSTVIFSSLYRFKKIIPLGEFLNVCGRAGRPYAASEGHVLLCAYPAPSIAQMNRNLTKWRNLVRRVGARRLRSGIFEIVSALINEMQLRTLTNFDELEEYVVGLRAGNEDSRDRADDLDTLTDSLDESILALIGSSALSVEGIADALDVALQSSLWDLELLREEEETADRYSDFLIQRSERVWLSSTAEQRQRFYLAGMNLRDGLVLDELVPELIENYVAVEAAYAQGNNDALVSAATDLLRNLFEVRCFRGDAELPGNWENLLARWLGGEPLVDGGVVDLDTLQFLQGTCGFNAVWGIEVVRALLARNEGIEPADYPSSHLSVLLEYGVPTVSAALLLKAGFESRLAATAVGAILPAFDTTWELLTWLDLAPPEMFVDIEWPSADAEAAWKDFSENHRSRFDSALGGAVEVRWYGAAPPEGAAVDIYSTSFFAELQVYAEDAEQPIGEVLRLDEFPERDGFRAIYRNGQLLKLVQ